MSQLIEITRLKIKLTLKDRGALIWMFLAPIIFAGVMILVFGNADKSTGEAKYPIDIVDEDKGHNAAMLQELLKQDKTFELINSDYQKARQNIQNGKTVLGLVIPAGFSQSIDEGKVQKLEVLKLQDNDNTIAMMAIVENYIYQLKLGVTAGNETEAQLTARKLIPAEEGQTVKGKVQAAFLTKMESTKIGYQATKLTPANMKLNALSSAAIGVFVMFIMFFVSGGAGSILEEKETGTWGRLLATPTGNNSILGGFILGSFLIGWIQTGVLILVSRYIFHVNWGSSSGGLILLFSSFLLAIIGLGTALASLVKSRGQLSALTTIIVMPTSLIAGCMWPRDFMPESVQKIADFVPQSWVLKGMTDLVARGSDMQAVYFPTAILLLFTIVFFLAGSTIMRLRSRA